MRRLIVNADDLGLGPGVDAGILRAARAGVVTRASLMVDRPHAAAAVTAARSIGLPLGLHVDLGDWVFHAGRWRAVGVRVDLEDPEAVRADVDRQVARFEGMVGRPPGHIDSHQHTHREGPARDAVLGWAERLGIPCRGDGQAHEIGGFYGQETTGSPWPEGVRFERLAALVRTLPAGTSELVCHPGAFDDDSSTYGPERILELGALLDPRLPAELAAAQVVLTAAINDDP